MTSRIDTSPGALSGTLSADRRRRLGTVAGMLVATPALLIIIGVAARGRPLPVVFPSDAPGTSLWVLFLESPFSLAAMVIVSLTLATWVIGRPSRLVAGLVILASVVLVFFDVVQLMIQIAADATGLAILTVVVIVLRVGAAAVAARLVRP